MAEDTFWKGPRDFAVTRWSVISRAQEGGAGEKAQALNDLCEAYWYPLYAFIRRKGYGPEAAQDLAQDFLAHWLQGPALQRAAEERGRFRTFLLRALSDFLVDQHRRAQAQKRGGAVTHVALDGLALEARYRLEPLDAATPEVLYDRQFAAALLERARERWRAEAKASARPEFTFALEPYLLEELPDGAANELGEKFGLAGPAVSAALYRQRQRLRKAVLAEVQETVTTPEESDAEMRHLFAALSAE